MKKITFSFKSLLIAAGLLIGSANAWGGNVVATLNHTAGNAGGSSTSGVNSVDCNTGAADVAGEFFNTDGTSNWAGWAFADFSFTIPDGQYILSATLTYSIHLGENKKRTYELYYLNDGISLSSTEITSNIYSDGASIYDFLLNEQASKAATAHTSLKYDGHRTKITVTDNALTQATKNFTQDVTNAVKAIYDAGQNYIIFQWTASSSYSYLHGKGKTDAPTLTITTVDASSNVSYTVKFQDTGGNTIKDDVVYTNGVVGEVYSAPSSDLITFYSADTNKKYVYKSGQNSSTEASSTASENVVTLVFDTYTKYHYALTTSAGAQEDTQEGDKYSDESITLYYPVCIKDGSDYYVVDKNASTPYYGYTLSSEETSKTITYTLDPDVVYYAEAENIASQVFSTDWLVGSSSRGASTILQANKSSVSYLKTDMGTTLDGVYNITIASGDRANKAYDRTWYLIDEDDNTTELKKYSFANNQFITDEIIATIPAGSEIYYRLDNSTSSSALNDNYAIDYILVRKVPAVELTSSATLEGYKTFYNATTNYEVDANTTIYKASTASSTVTLTAVGGNNIIKAGEAVILKTTNATDYTITLTPTTTASTGDFDGNALTYKAEAGTVANAYVLGYVAGDGNGLGFYHYTASLPAGSIYVTAAGGGAKALRIVVDGEATGIAAPEVAEKAEDGVLYNLNGQVVTEDYKGIVIKNGKKFYNK